MSTKVTCYTLPEPSTAMHSPSARLDFNGGTLTLRYDYDRYRDEQFLGVFRSGLRFLEVRAHRHREEAHCTVWHIQGTLDTFILVA